MLEADVDSYINGQCLYLDSTLDMFVNKENTTFYRLYKKANQNGTFVIKRLPIAYVSTTLE